MLFKCKICGGNLNVTSGERVTECEYCGVKQTIPRFTEPETQEVYNRANSYLKNNEFDKAENLYNQILFKNKKDADAYWNVLMCRYGVTYVKDPASGKYIPTCNRTLYNSIFNDENYLNAIEYADEQQKALYEENAQTIDNIQKGILSVSKKEKPFDIFISYKETDVNGARTNDSIAAQELYNKLTAEGYKVFFSRITLEDKIGSEYEPYIYAALASSKVMITVSSSKENIEAVWVKNEWSRFLSFMAKDSSKSIIPLYYDMPKTDLPDEFAYLTAYDMHENGFEQELIRGIKKLIPTPVVLKERRKKRNKILKRVGIAAIACLIVGVICAVPWLLKLPDYNAAMQLYYDKNYPEAAWAFGSLGDYRNCAEMKKKCELSWRKSLANVIVETLDGAKGDGIYYIDNNGSVQRVGVSRLNMKLDIGQHGKVVSLAPNNKTNVIYEDGFVSNISNSVQNKEKWNDIIMMSDYFDDTTIALRADGTMIYDVIDDNKKHKGNSSSYGNSNEWMKPISKWKNIVAFCAEKLCGNGYTYDSAIITGLKSDGTVESVKYKNPTHSNSCIICRKNEYNVSEFKNVKYINNNVAINKTGEVLSYINGKFNKREFKNAVEVYTEGNQIYVLDNEGNIVDLYSNSVVSKDIVHKSDWYYVSRNGNVHVYDEIVDSVKVPVYKEWTERMR